MKRRDFLKFSLASWLLAGTAAYTGKLFAAGVMDNDAPFDLVAVKNGEPGAMFDAAMKAMGGMGNFVNKGQTVVVKPNIGWDAPPERAANTNPALVKRIVEHCIRAGAKTVYVFDNTCDNWINCYRNSGIEKAVKDAGGKMVPGNTEANYQEVTIAQGKTLKKTKVHELILESDVFINVPILKNHSAAQLTISMKNLMGIIWDRYYWHRTNLNQCIADFATYRKPDLNVVDAYRVIMKRGPKGVSMEDVSMMKSLIVTKDMVAADTAATKLFGKEPDKLSVLRLAAELGVGKMGLEQLNIKRIAL
ncbi:MAG: DUF362 domain-containing protein [Bacteroidetes bacterium]|nr:DUF362 domain-containing protein [Bacteroidota bacterium]